MKIYAIKGENLQTILSDGITKKAAGLGAEYIPMESERPTPEHVAAAGGVWVLPEPEAIQSNE
ncbi:hypothetical protein [Marinomonas primoryensis]|uniref:hypothetical protein n=1 Tax=Marinomonas primoryensis TaxID=178399 RepID=UPI0030D7FDA6|tara:strand:- start:1827 stop:2015 length:189 start_codon:yes stop_codon:yes gene_type:complete